MEQAVHKHHARVLVLVTPWCPAWTVCRAQAYRLAGPRPADQWAGCSPGLSFQEERRKMEGKGKEKQRGEKGGV